MEQLWEENIPIKWGLRPQRAWESKRAAIFVARLADSRPWAPTPLSGPGSPSPSLQPPFVGRWYPPHAVGGMLLMERLTANSFFSGKCNFTQLSLKRWFDLIFNWDYVLCVSGRIQNPKEVLLLAYLCCWNRVLIIGCVVLSLSKSPCIHDSFVSA